MDTYKKIRVAYFCLENNTLKSDAVLVLNLSLTEYYDI